MGSLNKLCGFAAFVILISKVSAWSYDDGNGDGPSNWADTDADCGLNSQSPIDIVTANVEAHDYEDFRFDGYSTGSGVTMTLENNGHSAKVSLSGADLTLSGGDLPADYTFWQLHFHWGSVDSQGSEHTIDSTEYPMELHLVHYKSTFASGSVAADQPEGLAVLGFFFEISDSDNENLANIVSGLSNVVTTDDTHTISTFDIAELIDGALGDFYRYSGSLTTPACYESVVWTVFTDTIPISSAQLAEFRSLLDSSSAAVQDNYRPVQALNSRTVTLYEDDDDGACANLVSATLMLGAALISLIMN